MADRGGEPTRLREYRRRRSFEQTPEPVGGDGADGTAARFVVQEHSARRLHWDLRLEREGVAVSWALPRGVPDHPDDDRLAVHTEDHPLEYLEFEGEIPAGQYGAGTMKVWDRGTYVAEKFEPKKVVAVFAGERVRGRYALFQTRGKNWMIHRMDPPADPAADPMPQDLEPMYARLSKLPRDEHEWAFEIKWDGVRALAYVDHGHLRLQSRSGRDITAQFPEIRPLARQLGARRAVLDGELIAFGDDGRPSFQRLQGRIHLASEGAVRRRMKEIPVTFVVFDVLYLDGELITGRPYEGRREALLGLDLQDGPWQVPAHHVGDGRALLEASRRQRLEGVIAKRLGSAYEPGRRSGAWLKVKNVLSQEMVIGGWLPGKGRRGGTLGALLVGHYEEEDGEPALRYAGKVGTGFSEQMLADLLRRLEPLRREESPFTGRQPQRGAVFAEPRLVAEVEFSEWTAAGTLRQPSFKGLRNDKEPLEVRRERPAG